MIPRIRLTSSKQPSLGSRRACTESYTPPIPEVTMSSFQKLGAMAWCDGRYTSYFKVKAIVVLDFVEMQVIEATSYEVSPSDLRTSYFSPVRSAAEQTSCMLFRTVVLKCNWLQRFNFNRLTIAGGLPVSTTSGEQYTHFLLLILYFV